MRQLTFALAFEALYIFLKTLFFRFRKYFSESLLPGLLSAGIFLGIPLIFNASLLYAYHNIYAYTGGRNLRSPYVQEALEYSVEKGLHPVIAVDWGLGHIMQYLFFPEPPFIGPSSANDDIYGFISKYSESTVKRRKVFYIFKVFFDPFSPDGNFGPESEKFYDVLDKISGDGYTVEPEKIFFNKTGAETCAIYKVSRIKENK